MTHPEKPEAASAIHEAIRAKRERKSRVSEDIAALEASLLADIEAFDLDAAERRARGEQNTNTAAGISDPSLVFPEIVPTGLPRRPVSGQGTGQSVNPEADFAVEGSLLDQLRRQAELQQRQQNMARTERNQTNEAIDQALKHLFFYLHDFVQQLNIVKPAIPRDYPLVEQLALSQLTWQDGFADYRTQSQSAGAMVELVIFSYSLSGAGLPVIERDGPAVERFRAMLFDYGLQFSCKEFKNARSYIERAEFSIASELSVSARWRADFTNGRIVLETRNLERLGSAVYPIAPGAIDQSLLDAFGRLVLGQPSPFRELARRG